MSGWIEFICSGKEPAILKATCNAGGIHKGGIYKSWYVSNGMYRIHNDRDNDVKAPESWFDVVSLGDLNG
jgi:hypothetical protein